MSPQEMVARVERAENDAFLTLYEAAAECCGTGSCETGGVYAVWSTRDDDPGYSCVLNLVDASDPIATLRHVEERARAAGAQVLGIDAPPKVMERVGDVDLREAGFYPDYQECMWGRPINADEMLPAPEGVKIVRAGEQDQEIFARVLNIGYEIPADAIRGRVFASTIGQPGWRHYLAVFDGEPGAASVLYVTEGVAQLFVATTIPRFRGRGAQTALIRRRLADAQSAGCDLATSQTVVDNASPRNMGRHGFQPLYYRWIYGKLLL